VTRLTLQVQATTRAAQVDWLAGLGDGDAADRRWRSVITQLGAIECVRTTHERQKMKNTIIATLFAPASSAVDADTKAMTSRQVKDEFIKQCEAG